MAEEEGLLSFSFIHSHTLQSFKHRDDPLSLCLPARPSRRPLHPHRPRAHQPTHISEIYACLIIKDIHGPTRVVSNHRQLGTRLSCHLSFTGALPSHLRSGRSDRLRPSPTLISPMDNYPQHHHHPGRRSSTPSQSHSLHPSPQHSFNRRRELSPSSITTSPPDSPDSSFPSLFPTSCPSLPLHSIHLPNSLQTSSRPPLLSHIHHPTSTSLQQSNQHSPSQSSPCTRARFKA